MVCEKCKKNQATVHMKKIIGGEVKETYFCGECASLEDVEILSFQNMFQDLFSFSYAKDMTQKQQQVIKCPVCQMTYNEFKQKGKLGCESCYKAFNTGLDNMLKSIHTGEEHKGKLPKKSGGELLTRRTKENLKRKLAVAIEKEEFEEAAKLRDEIRALEGGAEI